MYEYTNCLYWGWGLELDTSSERCYNPAPSLQIRSFCFLKILPNISYFHRHVNIFLHWLACKLYFRPQIHKAPCESSRDLQHSYMHACITSRGSSVQPALKLKYLLPHSPLACSPFWQMTRGDVKSEQAQRGGMSTMALWFVSCYLHFATAQALQALPLQIEMEKNRDM